MALWWGGEKKEKRKGTTEEGRQRSCGDSWKDTRPLTEHRSSSIIPEDHALRWLVLDEADRLMDAGFEKQLMDAFDIIDECSPPGCFRQTIMASATIGDTVQRLAKRIQNAPVIVNANVAGSKMAKSRSQDSHEKSSFATPRQLVQHYIVIDARQRLVALAAFLRRQLRRSGGTAKLIVFVSSRACVEFLHVIMSRIEWKPPKTSAKPTTGFATKWWKLHGSIPQTERTRAVASFSNAEGGVMICTDVAARGLDLPSVDWIVQYDPPSEVSEYVHRVGRTARSGRRGAALLFLIPSELEYVNILQQNGINVAPLQTGPLFFCLYFRLQRRRVQVRNVVRFPMEMLKRQLNSCK